ncbi:MAG TPA: class I SAM-dependent methyltransferase [Ktedonobacteraceae bacterium]|nr:class I SAM-dependent methyltransferase [Ktedonobacteraceae bacterium]
MSHAKTGYNAQRMTLVQDMLKELRAEISSDAKILDFGCGDGELVHEFRKQGFQAYRIDIEDFYSVVQQRCREEGLVAADEELFYTLDMNNYRLPFADNTFDCILSFYVFEHVQNWQQALAEIQRVLKPGGACLHIFPSKYSPLEPHIFVPFGGVMQSRAYLAIWAMLGIKNSYQKQLSRREIITDNSRFLRSCTTYYSKAEIIQRTTPYATNILFVEDVYIRHHFGRVRRYLYPLSRRFPLIAALFSTLYTRVLFFQKGEGSEASSTIHIPVEVSSHM